MVQTTPSQNTVSGISVSYEVEVVITGGDTADSRYDFGAHSTSLFAWILEVCVDDTQLRNIILGLALQGALLRDH